MGGGEAKTGWHLKYPSPVRDTVLHFESSLTFLDCSVFSGGGEHRVCILYDELQAVSLLPSTWENPFGS